MRQGEYSQKTVGLMTANVGITVKESKFINWF